MADPPATRRAATADVYPETSRAPRPTSGAGRARQPAAWEIVSAAVRRPAAADPAAPHLAALLPAYRELAPGQDDSLRPEARLAEQVYRLGAAVCADGCRACLHQPSPLMADELTPAA